MQWEGQELQTQLFSPNGAAQEVPVSQEPSTPATLCPCTAVPVEKKKTASCSHSDSFKLLLSPLFSVASRIYSPAHYWVRRDTKPRTSCLTEAWTAHYRCVLACLRPLPATFIRENPVTWFLVSICCLSLDSSSAPGSRRNVARWRSLPRSRATSISTLTPRGHWSCRPRRREGHNPCAGRSAVGYIFVVVQQLGMARRHWGFYTHTGWISSNQSFKIQFFITIIFIIIIIIIIS